MIKKQETNFNLEQGQSVGPQVYKILKEQIIRGELTPGTRISEAEISRVFSVSRQPVREAFIKLRDEGLVEVRPQRGTFVTKISIHAVSDARFIREAIEADLARALAEKCTPEIISQLRTILAEQAQIDKNDVTGFMELDEKFHRTIAEGAGKPIAWQVIANMKSHFDRVRYLSTKQKPLTGLIAQHTAIVDAIEKCRPDEAEQQIRSHLREVLQELPEMTAQKPELFKEE